jgi:Protein of unknown function (DUF1822)
MDLSDFTATPIDSIDLTSTQIQRALNFSQSAPDDSRWSQYLSALADNGFEAWLANRIPTLPARRLTELATGLWRINGFRVQTIVCLEEDEILVPVLDLDRPETAAQIYVAIGVMEETSQVFIAGTIRYDQILAGAWSRDADAYRIPLGNLSPSTNQLLLTLRCADPATIPQPVPARLRINVGQWLNQQLDDLATALTWVLMPPNLAPSAMRSADRSAEATPEQTLAQILHQLGDETLITPNQTSSAYQDLPIGELRLYVTIGAIGNDEWSFLAILGTQSGAALPVNLQLSITCADQRLFHQTVEVARSQSYLYAQTIGDQTESFQVTITLPDGREHNLPEFAFQA